MGPTGAEDATKTRIAPELIFSSALDEVWKTTPELTYHHMNLHLTAHLNMDLPQISSRLSSSPTAFPNCCLALSSPLISRLASLLPTTPHFTLSIGSGAGLLEALLAYRHPNVLIKGVEVNSSVNLYIAEQDMYVVSGTWDLLPRASDAIAWMFVYPREPKLVTKYIESYGLRTKLILWLGPRADWADYEACFRDSAFSQLSFEDVGLAEYEMLVVASKRCP